MQGYTLRFIIYYLILLNLTLADPHIELILARLSYPGQHQHHCQQHHPKSCNLITNHSPPPPPPTHKQHVPKRKQEGHTTPPLSTPGNQNMGNARDKDTPPPLFWYFHSPPSPPLSLMPHSLGPPWLEAHQGQPLLSPPVRYCLTP